MYSPERSSIPGLGAWSCPPPAPSSFSDAEPSASIWGSVGCGPAVPSPRQPQMLQVHGHGGRGAGLLPGLVHLTRWTGLAPLPLAGPQGLLPLGLCISSSCLES